MGPSTIQSGSSLLQLVLALGCSRHRATLVADSRGGYGRILENFASNARPQILEIHVSLAARLPSCLLRLLVILGGHLLR